MHHEIRDKNKRNERERLNKNFITKSISRKSNGMTIVSHRITAFTTKIMSQIVVDGYSPEHEEEEEAEQEIKKEKKENGEQVERVKS